MQLDFPLTASRKRSVRSGAVIVPDRAAIFRIEGPGALTCLQGLLTNDLAAPGEGSLLYGALLTPKGMIVVDPWVLREAERFTLVIAAPGREAAAALLRRVLPPRLARVTDLSDEWSAAWLLGSGALERFARANDTPHPAPGKVLGAPRDGGSLLAAGNALSPFGALLVGPRAEVELMTARFAQAGGELADEAALAAARVLAGWPSFGREIDERTLPQEVRYDELGAVSYVKGCYTGQETVARVHFRGHVNRTLRGVQLEGGQALEHRTLQLGDKEVGSIKSALLLEDRVLALAVIRREVADGARLLAGGRVATVLPLPIEPSAAA